MYDPNIPVETRANIRALFLKTKSNLLANGPERPKEKSAMLPKALPSEFEDDEPTRTRKKTKRSTTVASSKSSTIPLSWEQVQKLWNIVMGGHLITEEDEDTGEISYHVSLEAISKAVPVLLEKL